ncbi:hypothetical protein, partial [Vibrio cholerae]|uniref:hypothetical protein n=1 Tax=Vibrio cholerae TaxID=666 RepID=UPI001E3FD748
VFVLYLFFNLISTLDCMKLGCFQLVSPCFLFLFSLRIDADISIDKDVVFKKEFNTFQLFFGKSYIG